MQTKTSGVFNPGRSASVPFTRWKFLRTTALAGMAAPFVLPSGLRAAPLNSKLNHACIGVGGMGRNDLNTFLRHPRLQVVAVCDVDANNLDKAAKAAPGARTYSDWRELLTQEGDKIDSVNLAVPDHTHFSIAYSAIRRGKHVYCQKPMCHDVAEVCALTEAAIKKRVVTQLAAGLSDPRSCCRRRNSKTNPSPSLNRSITTTSSWTPASD